MATGSALRLTEAVKSELPDKKLRVGVRTAFAVQKAGDRIGKPRLTPGCSVVQALFALRPRLPSAMDPQPLIRGFTDSRLDRVLNPARIFNCVARYHHRWIEAQDIAALLPAPRRETRNHGRSPARGEFFERKVR